MVRVVIIINGHATKTIGTSGGEEHCIMIANHLYSNNYDIFICCPQKYNNLNRIKTNRSLIYRSIPFEEKFYSNLVILFCIYWYRIFLSLFKLRNFKSNFIIASSHLFYDILPTLFARKNQVFITYIYHIIAEQERKRMSLIVSKFLEKISFYIIKKRKFIVFVDSGRIKDILCDKYNFRKNNVFITKNGINLQYIESIKNDHKKTYDICFCGRLSKMKGVFDLIEIVKDVRLHYPKIQCATIGQGPEKNNILKEIADNHLEKNIRLFGFLSEKDKITTLKSSKLFVLPSHEEGWGIVIGEAIACGLPVIVYKLKDIVEIWKDNVIWVKCFDLNEFSHKVIELLKNDKERKLFIQKGLKFANTLDWKDILNKELSIILKK